MAINNNYFHYMELALKRLEGAITAEEAAELADWLNADDGKPLDLPESFAGSREELENRMLAYLTDNTNPVIPFWRKVVRIAAAAAVLVLLIGGGWYWASQHSSKAVSQNDHLASQLNDVAAPKGSKAILTLSNGQHIVLDSAGSSTLAMQGNTKVVRLADGRLIYDGIGASGKMEYNTLTVPRGSNITSLTLSDGTKVWLNAGSSLIYPVAFIGPQRKVEMTGEAYFEVTKKANQPFHVHVSNMDVEVLGTQFNINGYGDEPAIQTTLLEGAVKVNKTTLLSPGLQSQLAKNGNLKVVDGVDMEEAVAWKNGAFSYTNADISVVLRQLARWYDIDVVYEGGAIGDKFTGGMPRTASLSQVLKMLQLSRVHFKLEERTLTILP